MPSVQDVADQINAKLDTISANTGNTVAVGNQIRADLAGIDARLVQLDSDFVSGITQLAQGLFAIWETQKATNAILDHQSSQNDAIICLLGNATELLCGINRKLSTEVELTSKLVESVDRIEGIIERSDFDRMAEVKRELLACCPPPDKPEEPCPDECPPAKERRYNPKGQDWKPPQGQKPIG